MSAVEQTPAPAGPDTTPKPTSRRRRVAAAVARWDWRSHPPQWATVNISLALLWVTWAAWKLGVPPAVAFIGGALGALGAIAAAMIAEAGTAVIWWRLACWALPAIWAAASLQWSPWQPVVLVCGLALAISLGVISAAVRRVRRTARQVALAKAARGTGLTGSALAVAPADEVWQADTSEDSKVPALGANWTARIRRVCRIKGAQVTDIAMWPQGTGYTLRVKLPLGGVSWRQIQAFSEELAEDAGLAPDCGVTVKPSKERRGIAEIQVTHRNMMSETHLAPADYSPTSIYQRAGIGILPDGTVFRVALKWVWMVLIGQPDSGKTSMLHLINLFLFRCTDTVVWHIDIGGGGGISRPWVTPWHEGRAPHPNADWAATTKQEAELMCRAALAIIEGRKRHYRDRMDDGKIICSPEVPHIVIVSDETANLPERVKDLLVQATQTGRAAGVRGITCALRATAEDLPRAIKQHSRLRIGMRASDADEIRYLFDAPGKIDPELASERGSGWVEHQDEDETGKPVGRKYLTPFKAFFLPDRQIDEAAVAVAPLRPQLDAASAALADSVSADRRAYTDRWKRVIPELFVIEDEVAPVQGDPDRAARIQEAEARQRDLHETGGSVDERLGRLSALRDKILGSDGEDDTSSEGVDREMWAELTGGLVDNLSDVLAVVDQAGPGGIGPAEIHRRVNASRAEADQIDIKTVQRKLDELLSSGAVVKPRRGVYISALHQ